MAKLLAPTLKKKKKGERGERPQSNLKARGMPKKCWGGRETLPRRGGETLMGWDINLR